MVVRLRSIGDTVLATPSLIALRRFLPDTQIDILLEDWVAPLLDGFDGVDNVISVGKGTLSRFATLLRLRREKYDVAFNLHGGTTSTFFTVASGARHRVGYEEYRYSFLYNHAYSSSADFWGREKTHSAEQQLALLGFAGVPVEDKPRSELAVSPDAARSLAGKFAQKATRFEEFGRFALIHPAAAFVTKQWATENFAQTAAFLAKKGLRSVAVAARHESGVLDKLSALAPLITFDDLSLPEITALASKAAIFIGNDSGIAHIAAAMNTPTVVIFGSSNRDHWRPWTDAPNEIVFDEFHCQPCAGYECKEFGEPRCILGVKPGQVEAAIEKVLAEKRKGERPAPAIS